MIGENVLKGLPFGDDVFIFDLHAHVYDTSDFRMTHTAPADVVKTLDRLGVNGCCVSAITSIHADCRLGNELMLEAVKAHPGRLYGYVTLSPHDRAADLDRYFSHPGVKGLKIHAAFHRTTIDDPRYESYFEYAEARGLPVLFHAWEAADSVNIAKWAKRFPHVKMIIGHGAVRIPAVRREAVDAVKKYENVFADTAVSLACDGAIEWAASQIGADRLCYGSDVPFYDCRHVLGKVATAKLSDSDKRKILGENARLILGL